MHDTPRGVRNFGFGVGHAIQACSDLNFFFQLYLIQSVPNGKGGVHWRNITILQCVPTSVLVGKHWCVVFNNLSQLVPASQLQ